MTIKDILKDCEQDFGLNNWKFYGVKEIAMLPQGKLVTYGKLAQIINGAYKTHIIARNVAWLREKLYIKYGHNSDLPLHRIAAKGDIKSLKDSEETRARNDILRKKEGIFANPKWL